MAVATPLQAVLVTCLLSGVLMKFNWSSGADAGAVPVGSSPTGVAFDAQNGRAFVADTSGLAVVTASTMTLTATIPLGGSPYGVTLDNATQTLYVSDYSGGNVTVVSAANNSILATIVLGSATYPMGIAFDSYNRDVYVAESVLDRVGVISAPSNALTQTVNLSGEPFAVATDSNSGMVYAALTASSQVVAISGLNQSVVATLDLPAGPVALTVEASAHRLYVDASNVTVVNTSSFAIVGFVPVGVEPTDIQVDESTGRVYVTDFASSDVAVIDEATSQVLSYFRSDPGPVGVAWNDVSKDIDVTDQASGALVQVSGSRNGILATSLLAYGLTGVAANGRTGNLFVTNKVNNRVYDTTSSGEVLGSVMVGGAPLGLAFDDRNGNVYVANSYANTVSVINGSSGALLGNISIPPPTGIGGGLDDVAYDPANGYLYVSVEGCACSMPGNVTVIDGASNQIVGTILGWLNPGPSADVIDSQNNELYVTDNFLNAVWAFNASTYQLISITPVGIAPEGLAVDTQSGYIYVTNSGSGNVSVIDPSTNSAVESILVGAHPGGAVFDPVNGAIYVANEYSGTLSVIGIPYNVTFTESGLPQGTTWSVSIADSSNRTHTTSLSFSEPDGTYNFSIGSSDARYRASGGVLTVEGGPVNRSVPFSAVTYDVSFAEVGLASGTNWSVVLNGSTQSSTGTAIVFPEPNGSYSFTVRVPSGYHSSPTVGSFNVDGANVTEAITFSTLPTFLGLPGETGYYLIVGIGAVAAILIALVVIRTRRSKRDANPSRPTPPSTSPPSENPPR